MSFLGNDAINRVTLHAYIALLGDAEARGRQIGVRAAAEAVANIAAPWAGGWALTALGPAATFGLVAVVQVLAIMPLVGLPSTRVAETAPRDSRDLRLAVVLQASDGGSGPGSIMSGRSRCS